MVALYLTDGREVSLRGTSGTVFLDGHELKRVEVEGAIEVQLGDYELSTDRASYEADRDLVIAPGTVHITGNGLDVRGQRMEVDIAQQRLRLVEQVRAVLHPKT